MSTAYGQKLYDAFQDYDQGLVAPGVYNDDPYADTWGPMQQQLSYLPDEDIMGEEGEGYGADYQTFAPISEVDEEIRQESSRCSNLSTTSSSPSFEDTSFVLNSRCRHLSLEVGSAGAANRLHGRTSSYPLLSNVKKYASTCQKIFHASLCQKPSDLQMYENIGETQGSPTSPYSLRGIYAYEPRSLLHAATRQLDTNFWDASNMKRILNLPSNRAQVCLEEQPFFHLIIRQTPIEYSYVRSETQPATTNFQSVALQESRTVSANEGDSHPTEVPEDTARMFSQTVENSLLQLWDGAECLYEERRQEEAEMPNIIIMPENVYTSEDDEEEEEGNEEGGGSVYQKNTSSPIPDKADELFLSIRRCRNFENISQLSLSPVPEENGDVSRLDFNSKAGVATAKTEYSDQGLIWETNYSASLDGLPVHRWGRLSKPQFSSASVAVGDAVAGLSIFAEDQILEKQDDQEWASLLPPSECILQSAKGFSTKLEEMVHLDENEEFDVADLGTSTGQVCTKKIILNVHNNAVVFGYRGIFV
ncbi:unnamed protein product [Dibothriocephalus latus]|uniref:Uncharacterized protein n=1 Tax=Dibothriocephalus latus TaxID=60516 RepID=A0A3P7NA02_DIBLA|nr:unnamed protein product [Dibothriocephalus latus]